MKAQGNLQNEHNLLMDFLRKKEYSCDKIKVYSIDYSERIASWGVMERQKLEFNAPDKKSATRGCSLEVVDAVVGDMST